VPYRAFDVWIFELCVPRGRALAKGTLTPSSSSSSMPVLPAMVHSSPTMLPCKFLVFPLSAAILLLSPLPALAATRTWDGGGLTNNWSEAANWSSDTAPTAADTALFDSTDATDVTVDSDILIGGLTVTSGYGGTLNLGSATITGAVGDGAVQFTAADKSYLSMGTNYDPGTSDFSVSFWAYLDTSTTYGTIIDTGGITNTAGFSITAKAGNDMTIFFKAGATARVYNTEVLNGTFGIGQWHHIIVNFDRDGNAQAYQNGSATGTPLNISSGNDISMGATTGSLGSSINVNTGNPYFNGRLDSFGIWNRLLTESEITALYNGGQGLIYEDLSTSDKVNLQHWYNFGESAGIRYDSHGTNHLTQVFGNIIAPPVYGSELLTNGGFETTGVGADVFGTWQEGVGGGAIADETSDVHGGSHAAKLTGSESNDTTVLQEVGATAGQVWRLSFWSHGDGINSSVYQVYNYTAGTNIAPSSRVSTGITGTTYALTTFEFTVPAGCTSLGVLLRPAAVAGAIAYFDDVSLKRITTASINNGGFEDWTTSTNAGTWSESVAGTSTVNREDTAPYNGTNAARLDVDASNSNASVQQSVLTVGKLGVVDNFAG